MNPTPTHPRSLTRSLPARGTKRSECSKAHRAVLRWSPTTPPFDVAFVSYSKRKAGAVHPYWNLPATPAAYQAQVEAMARSLAQGVAKNDSNKTWLDNSLRYLFVAQAKRALAALNIKEPKP